MAFTVDLFFLTHLPISSINLILLVRMILLLRTHVKYEFMNLYFMKLSLIIYESLIIVGLDH